MKKSAFIILSILSVLSAYAQDSLTNYVNVFLGTSGDHGQLSPSASTPFNMMNLGPQTNPHQHTGYEFYAKEFDGFTHTRMEGVGCTGRIDAKLSVDQNFGLHEYIFPNNEGSIYLDLSFALSNRFVSETHTLKGNILSGSIETKTTCHAGTYHIYFAIQLPQNAQIRSSGGHQYIVKGLGNNAQVQVSFSSVSEKLLQPGMTI